MQRQPRIVGGRIPVTSGFIRSIEAAVKREQDIVERKTGLRPSRSFVIATAVAFALGVPDQADYLPSGKRTANRLERPHLTLVRRRA